MSDLRRRKVGSQNGVKEKARNSKELISDTSTSPSEDSWTWLLVVEVVVALAIAVIVGYKYALYAKELHENDMWFSNIGVSKEIASY